MAAASAYALREPAEHPSAERLHALLDAVALPELSPWAGEGAEAVAPAPLFREVPVALQERKSDNWLAWNVGRVRPDPFAVLFERYWRQISAVCFSIVGTRDEAEDAASETMSRAYATLSRRAERPEFRPWIHAIARNAALDRIRQRSRGPQLAETDEVLEVPMDETPGDVLGRRERLTGLVADLQALSERQRAAIVMRELSGMSHEEIASALHTTPARSQALVADARQSLTNRRAGREIRCGEYRRAVDDRGRLPRGHRLAAHREACSDCRGYARPRLLNGFFFLPVIELFSRAGRRIADAAGPALSSAGPGGAAKLAAGAAVVAMTVPGATEGPQQRDPVRDGAAPVVATTEDDSGGAAAEPGASRDAVRRAAVPGSEADARSERTPAAAPAEPVDQPASRAPEPADKPAPEGDKPAGGSDPVENVRGALPALPELPTPDVRVPGVQVDENGVSVDTEQIVRDVAEPADGGIPAG